MKKLILGFILFIAISDLQGRNISLSGYIIDGSTGERLIGASVFVSEKNATLTNNYGFFNLIVPEGQITVQFSYVGYPVKTLNFSSTRDTFLTVPLFSENKIEEVEITSNNPFRLQSIQEPGMKTISMKLVDKLPVLLGEQDIMRTLQLMPGVQPGSEGNVGLYVRGGESGDNLILVDGAEVFNPDHFLGFFSVFNEDAMNNVSFYTSGYPSQYNGKLASVTDIRMKDGNNQSFSVNGSIGLISSKLQIEGPLFTDKITYIFSGRRTYLDLLAKPLIEEFTDKDNANYYFYDINGKIKWQINEKSAFHLSNYSGEDKGYFSTLSTYGTNPPEPRYGYSKNYNKKDFNWGNNLLTARYEASLSGRFFMNVSASLSHFKYEGNDFNSNSLVYWQQSILKQEYSEYSLVTRSEINEKGLSALFEYDISPYHQLTFGTHYKFYRTNPAVESLSDNVDHAEVRNEIKKTIPYFFIQDNYSINKIRISAGVNINKMLNSGSKFNFDKRISFSCRFNEKIHSSISYSEATQYFHLLTLSKISLASDLWLMSGKEMKPSGSKDFTISTGYAFSKGYSIEVSAYYRHYNNLLQYREGASYSEAVENFEELVTTGEGHSKGLEIMVEKNTGKTKGFVSYSLSKSTRDFDELNDGKSFRARYDRPHVLNVALTRDFGKRWTVGALFSMMSGATQTFADQLYISCFDTGESPYDNTSFTVIGYMNVLDYNVNAYRLPLYHRLDISFTYRLNSTRVESSINFGLYNAYNAKNVYDVQQVYVNYGYSGDSSEPRTSYEAKEKSLFPVIPFVSYVFKY